MYPNIKSPNFRQEIANMFEFRYLKNRDQLFQHQEFVRRFMSPHTPYKFLVVFHGLGSGKTYTGLKVAEDHYLHSSKSTIIITKGSSAEDTFKSQIKKFNIQCRDIKYYHYIALGNKIKKMTEDKIKNLFSNAIVVMDEVHVLKDAFDTDSTLNQLLHSIRISENSKFLFMTGTPMINSADEINLLYKLCNTKDLSGYVSYTKISINKPTYEIVNIYTKLGEYQIAAYQDIKNEAKDIYKNVTHISLFTSPEGLYGSKLDPVFYEKKMDVFAIVNKARIKKGITYPIKERYKKNLSGEALKKCSGKYFELLRILQSHKRYKIFIFLEEVIGSGIRILCKILEENGYEQFFTKFSAKSKTRKFAVCTGDLSESPNNREKIDFFNLPENIYGEQLQILIGSKAVGESVNLYEVRYFHYITPHWNESTFEQSLGRTIRENSHDNLFKEDRHIIAYIHITSFPDEYKKESIDEYKYRISKQKQLQIYRYENILKNISVDRLCYEPITLKNLNCLSYYAFRMQNVEDQYSSCLRNKRLSEFDIAYLRHLMVNDIKVHDKYVRCIDGKYMLTGNISIPYYNFSEIQKTWNEGIPFEQMSYEEKTAFLERSITTNDTRYIKMLQTLYIVHDNTIYHAMNFRHSSSKSYNALIPLPRHKLGPLRMFKNNTWSDVPEDEEQSVVEVYREKFDRFLESVDRYPLKVGIRSVLDNKIRIRGRRHINDRRKTQRGLELFSRSSQNLVELCHNYGISTENVNKNSMIKSVYKFLEENELVFWI
jgi:superfamily II DNA or RNA helicase